MKNEEYSAILATIGELATAERKRGVDEDQISENAEVRYAAWLEVASNG